MIVFCLFMLISSIEIGAQTINIPGGETCRPKIHFSPAKNWVNDPNGMVYHNGIYHLFFQHHPHSPVWGPMHWGHATSKDLIHWNREPIGIYPDSLGTIFSGSAVVDQNNSSGFGIDGKAPLVAIFTQHDTVGEKSGRDDFQNQSIAYSNDEGKTWTKYTGNPVVKNPGIRDFRDPKVMWYEPQKKWVMSLATKDRITFYSSTNLKDWLKESEFGESAGAHGGVWECPDLFPLQDESGKQHWILIVSINPGGPNKGSATQYFIGDFDGHHFSSNQTQTRWIDYGPDDYAGVTWTNTGNRKIFLGWMTNWLYANKVPTQSFRNAMTLPRDLRLVGTGDELVLASMPVPELSAIQSPPVVAKEIQVNGEANLSKITGNPKLPCRYDLVMNEIRDFSLIFANSKNEELTIGYNEQAKEFYIDRTRSGKTDFSPEFPGRHTAPRMTDKKELKWTLIVDVSSVELFADDGLTVMTATFFPNQLYDQLRVQAPVATTISGLECATLKSIW